MKKLASEWFAKPERNYGLYIKADYKGENLVVYPDHQESNNRYVSVDELLSDSQQLT